MNNNTLERLRHTIQDFINKDSDQDLIKGGLGAQVEDLDQLKFLLNKLLELPYEDLSESSLGELIRRLSKFIDTINALVASFGSPAQNEVADKLNKFNLQYDLIFRSVLVMLQLISLHHNSIGEDTKRQEEEFKQFMTNTRNSYGEQAEYLDGVIKAIQDKRKDVEVMQYAGLFEKEAKAHRNNANRWLIVSGVLFIVIICWLLYMLKGGIDTRIIQRLGSNEFNNDNTKSIVVYYIIQQIVSKVLFASALFYSLAFSVKAFRASQHNSLINKHRQNALNSFEAFVNAPTADATTKNAVLLEATRTIFSHQSSGFDTSDKDSEVPNKIIEIFKPVG